MFFWLSSNIVRTIKLRQIYFIIYFLVFSCFDPLIFFSIRFFCACISNFSFSRKTPCFITCQRSGSPRLWMPRIKCVFMINLNTLSALTKSCCCVLNCAEIVKRDSSQFMADILRFFTKLFDNRESTFYKSGDNTFWHFLCLK